jgi:hypothetical protein
MLRRLILAGLVLAPCCVADAATLDGVTMPSARVADGTNLRLNGIGLRTYSVFGVRIYVAGLYLEQPSSDSDSILRSPEKKLLDIRFLRDGDAAHARRAWQDGFDGNCRPPECSLNPQDVARFLASVPAIHRGDETVLLFTDAGALVTFNGRPLGEIADRHFAETLLATFIGPAPPTPQLKQALLGRAE